MKKITVLLLAAALIFGCVQSGVYADNGVRGDFTNDGEVTSDDAVYLLRHTLFAESYPIWSDADFTNDGSITSDDAIYLLRYTLFPSSYPIGPGYSEGLTYTVNADGKTCTVTGPGTFFGASLRIPPSINGLKVTDIGDNAFRQGYNIKSITLPATLKTIGDTAFGWCDAVKTISIPDGVTSIAADAFYCCTALETVDLGDSVSSIGIRAFYGCSSLEEVVLPKELSVISNYSFFGCTSLRTVTLRGGVGQIKDFAFMSCSALADICFPGGTEEWNGLSKGKDWDTDTGDYTVHCTDGDVLSYNPGLKYVKNTNGDSYTVTDTGTFDGADLVIPATHEGLPVTAIAREAFRECDHITSVTIPKSVTSSDECAFDGCTSITKVYYKGEAAGWMNISFGDATANPLYSGAELILNGSAVTMIIVPGAVSAIGDAQFAGCSTLEEVSAGSKITRIGNEAFDSCTALRRVTLNDSPMLEEIGAYAFNGCSQLQTITIPDSVTSIGRYVLQGCESLTAATLGSGITSVPAMAFKGCMSLKTLTVKGKLTSIGTSAFAGCISLETVKFNGTRAEWFAIEKGNGWMNATGKFTVQCTDGYIYPDTDNLTFSANGSSCTVTGYSVKPEFNLAIPASWNGYSVTAVGGSAFKNCGSIVNLTIPASVVSIAADAFYGCTSLKAILYGGTKAQWNAISKASGWNTSTGSYVIRCLDGDISK